MTFVRFLAPFAFLSIGVRAFAQDNVTISGTITTRGEGSPVPGAVVSVIGATPSRRALYARLAWTF
jgi:hypothetical protein